MKSLGIYIHIPFCVKKCAYCDFLSGTDTSPLPAYISSLIREISAFKTDKKVKSIFASVPFRDVNEFRLMGKAKQNTTSGKNLLENIVTSQEKNGVVFTVNEDKSISVKGTASAEIYLKINEISFSDLNPCETKKLEEKLN